MFFFLVGIIRMDQAYGHYHGNDERSEDEARSESEEQGDRAKEFRKDRQGQGKLAAQAKEVIKPARTFGEACQLGPSVRQHHG